VVEEPASSSQEALEGVSNSWAGPLCVRDTRGWPSREHSSRGRCGGPLAFCQQDCGCFRQARQDGGDRIVSDAVMAAGGVAASGAVSTRGRFLFTDRRRFGRTGAIATCAMSKRANDAACFAKLGSELKKAYQWVNLSLAASLPMQCHMRRRSAGRGAATGGLWDTCAC
jgi:hypothetical protein